MKNYKSALKMFENHLNSEFFNATQTKMQLIHENELFFMEYGQLNKIGKNNAGVWYLGFCPEDSNTWHYQHLFNRYENYKNELQNHLNN